MSDLINKLNAALGKSPDEVVSALTGPKWYHLGTISEADHAFLFEKPAVLVNLRLSGTWHLVQTSFWFMWFELDYCHNNWNRGWVCLEKEWKRGLVPDLEAQHAAGFYT